MAAALRGVSHPHRCAPCRGHVHMCRQERRPTLASSQHGDRGALYSRSSPILYKLQARVQGQEWEQRDRSPRRGSLRPQLGPPPSILDSTPGSETWVGPRPPNGFRKLPRTGQTPHLLVPQPQCPCTRAVSPLIACDVGPVTPLCWAFDNSWPVTPGASGVDERPHGCQPPSRSLTRRSKRLR